MAQSILVSGAPGVGKRLLLSALLGDIDVDAAGTGAAEGVLAVHTWKLDTRYYTANVDVCLLHDEHLDIVAGAQGLLIVHDVSKPETFDQHVRKWGPVLENADTPPEVLLCVGLRPDGTDSPADGSAFVRTDCFDWCLDNAFEYLEIDTSDFRASNETPAPLSTRDAAEGIDRIVEAFQCHMWPSMEMKPRGNAGDAASEAVAEAATETATPNNGGGAQAEERDSAVSASAIRDAIDAGYAPAGSQAVVDSLLAAESAGAEDPSNDGGEKDLGEEAEAEALARLMEEMVDLKSRGHELGADVRREKAAALAMRLAALLGEDDDSDGDDQQ